MSASRLSGLAPRVPSFRRSSSDVIEQFRSLLENCVNQDAQRAYEMAHRETTVQLGEKLLDRGYSFDSVEEFTSLSKKEVFSLRTAHKAVEQEGAFAPIGQKRKGKVQLGEDDFSRYLDFLSMFSIIPFIQRRRLEAYNRGRWYAAKDDLTLSSPDLELEKEKQTELAESWERKTGGKALADTSILIIPAFVSGPAVWWNFLGVSRAGVKKIKSRSPFSAI